jgi:hypothetical protein
MTSPIPSCLVELKLALRAAALMPSPDELDQRNP